MEYNKENSVQKILVGYGVRDGIREMTLEQYREQITSRFTQNKVEALRRCEDEQQREALKRNSFYILPQGCIRENRRQYALGVQPTKENIEYRPDVQMLDLDIRPDDCPTAWDAYMKHVNNYLIELGIPHWPRVAMVSVSARASTCMCASLRSSRRWTEKSSCRPSGACSASSSTSLPLTPRAVHFRVMSSSRLPMTTTWASSLAAQ